MKVVMVVVYSLVLLTAIVGCMASARFSFQCGYHFNSPQRTLSLTLENSFLIWEDTTYSSFLWGNFLGFVSNKGDAGAFPTNLRFFGPICWDHRSDATQGSRIYRLGLHLSLFPILFSIPMIRLLWKPKTTRKKKVEQDVPPKSDRAGG